MPPVRSLLRVGLLLLALAPAALVASPVESVGVGGNTFTVNSNGDPGTGVCDVSECTLREAITKANLGQGNTIAFALPDCPAINPACVIKPTSALPTITKMTTIIDGTTQLGYTDTPIVVLDGSLAPGSTDALMIAADNAVIDGLSIRNWDGIAISDYSSTQVNLIANYDRMENNAGGGVVVALGGTGSELDMDGNTIINNGFTGVYAAYATMDKAVIKNNTISGNHGRGVDIAVSQDMTFTNNTINANLNNNEGVYAQSTTTNNVTFTNNHIINNTGAGAAVAASMSLDFTGNTINTNSGAGVRAAANTVTNLTLDTNTITGNQGNGFEGYASTMMTIDGNIVTGNAGTGILTSGVTVTNATITNNEVAFNSGGGLNVTASNNLTMTGNYIHENTGNGIDASGSATNGTNITGNNFSGNTASGVVVSGANVSAHFNRFFGTGGFGGLGHLGLGTVDGINNWWGCNAGPGDASCSQANGGVNSNPWLVLGIHAVPTSVNANGTSAITGNVIHDSNAADTSGSGHLKDGISVIFATDIGSTDSIQDIKPLANGEATTTFHAPNSPGTAHVSVTLDNETVTVPITIASPATPTPTPSPTPTPTPSGSVTPSPTPTHSPTPTPPGPHKQGDTNCDGHIDGADGLPPLVYSAGVHLTSVAVSCPAIDFGDPAFGDVNCDGAIDERDVIAILQYAAGVPIKPPPEDGCTPIGSALT